MSKDLPVSYAGLSFDEARERISISLDSVLLYLGGENAKQSWKEAAKDPKFRYWVSVCLLVLILYIVSVSVESVDEFQAGLVFTIVVYGVVFIINLFCFFQSYRSNNLELSSLISSIVQQYKNYLISQSQASASQPLAGGFPSIEIPSGHSQVSIVVVYRNNGWIKVPVLLLAEGDIIALMGGDITPCQVYELRAVCGTLTSSEGGGVGSLNTGTTKSKAMSELKWIKTKLIPTGEKIYIDETYNPQQSMNEADVVVDRLTTGDDGLTVNALDGETPRDPSQGTGNAATTAATSGQQEYHHRHHHTRHHHHHQEGEGVRGLEGRSNTADLRKSLFSKKASLENRHRSLGPESIEILRLCGNIRCFLVAETPIEAYVKMIYSHQLTIAKKNKDTFLQKLRDTFMKEGIKIILISLVLVIILAILRFIFFIEARQQFILTIFLPFSNILMIGFPVCIPLLRLLLRSLSIAEILANMEIALSKSEGSSNNPHATATRPSQLPPSSALSGAGGPLERKTTVTGGASRNPVHDTATGVSHNGQPQERNESDEVLNEFVDEDLDERVDDIAEDIAMKVEYGRYFKYVYKVLLSRLFVGYNHETSSSSVTSSSQIKPLLPIPLASINITEQLGAITMVCFVDDDIISENYSVTEEIFLLTENLDSTHDSAADLSKRPAPGGTGGGEKTSYHHTSLARGVSGSSYTKSTVLDLHANPEATGSRFENPLWWKFLPCLKPLGLNALLTYNYTAESNISLPSISGSSGGPQLISAGLRKSASVPASRAASFVAPPLPASTSSAGQGRAPPFGVINPLSDISAGHPPATSLQLPHNKSQSALIEIEKSLVRHIRKTMPLEFLRELSEEIGFSNDDLTHFQRVVEVNVLAPGLQNAHLLEDNHQWGQDETRRRGSLSTALRGGIYRDGRGGGLQMMSCGDPSLILNYCKEYWDGNTKSITPLNANDRAEVLSVYERWKLEDFDVVAFSYSPMPVAPLLYFTNNPTTTNTTSTNDSHHHHHHHHTHGLLTEHNLSKRSLSLILNQSVNQGGITGAVDDLMSNKTPTMFFVDPSSVPELIGGHGSKGGARKRASLIGGITGGISSLAASKATTIQPLMKYHKEESQVVDGVGTTVLTLAGALDDAKEKEGGESKEKGETAENHDDYLMKAMTDIPPSKRRLSASEKIITSSLLMLSKEEFDKKLRDGNGKNEKSPTDDNSNSIFSDSSQPQEVRSPQLTYKNLHPSSGGEKASAQKKKVVVLHQNNGKTTLQNEILMEEEAEETATVIDDEENAGEEEGTDRGLEGEGETLEGSFSLMEDESIHPSILEGESILSPMTGINAGKGRDLIKEIARNRRARSKTLKRSLSDSNLSLKHVLLKGYVNNGDGDKGGGRDDLVESPSMLGSPILSGLDRDGGRGGLVIEGDNDGGSEVGGSGKYVGFSFNFPDRTLDDDGLTNSTRKMRAKSHEEATMTSGLTPPQRILHPTFLQSHSSYDDTDTVHNVLHEEERERGRSEGDFTPHSDAPSSSVFTGLSPSKPEDGKSPNFKYQRISSDLNDDTMTIDSRQFSGDSSSNVVGGGPVRASSAINLRTISPRSPVRVKLSETLDSFEPGLSLAGADDPRLRLDQSRESLLGLDEEISPDYQEGAPLIKSVSLNDGLDNLAAGITNESTNDALHTADEQDGLLSYETAKERNHPPSRQRSKTLTPVNSQKESISSTSSSRRKKGSSGYEENDIHIDRITPTPVDVGGRRGVPLSVLTKEDLIIPPSSKSRKRSITHTPPLINGGETTDQQDKRNSNKFRPKSQRQSGTSAATATAGMNQQRGSHQSLLMKQKRREALRHLWSLMRQQIFLGMVASSVPVRRDVTSTKEDLDIAGIRFVYFSAQNMKRSKPVAEKIGITFDWNCAISLRNLDISQENDPHRHISNYADWDVKARMPHGIEAIREHIKTVDNVPLLVSLFTDATTETIQSMIDIFRENGETVLSIGSGYRCYNQAIYSSSNLSTSISLLPNLRSFLSANEKDLYDLFPNYSSLSLTKFDLKLSFDLIGLGTINLLQAKCFYHDIILNRLSGNDVVSGWTNRPDESTIDHLKLPVLLETIRKGRVLLLNELQCVGFTIIILLSLTFWQIVSYAIPLSIPPFCPPSMMIVFLLVYLPLLLAAIVFTDDHEGIMKNTPRKNILFKKPRDESRFLYYLSVRVLTIVFSIWITGYLTTVSVFKNGNNFLQR
jgi:hypothetical protein